MTKVLIAEDDIELSERLQDLLEADGFTVDAVIDGEEANEFLKSFTYELLILDWDLPSLKGIEICRRFRARGGSAPILMLTGKSSIDEKEVGFEAGADDYVTKPFHPRELRARIRALLRRPAQLLGDKISMGNVEYDPLQRTVWKAGSEVKLTALELDLFGFLIRHRGEVFSIEALIKGVWESDSAISDDAIYAAIKRLRKKLDSEGNKSIITNVHGLGYRMES